MSLIGKGSSSLRKKDVIEQKSAATGFKKLVFAHIANAGDASINLTALVAPPEMTSTGFLNPSVAELQRTNIFQLKNNLKLVSSLSGILMPYMSYTVNSSSTIMFNGFTAQQDEVFVGYIDEAPATSINVVNGQPIVASGILPAGQTDFNIGTPIAINKNPTTPIGDVMVFADRGLQYRKVGNQTTGDGDYIEVPVAGGLGSLIRFNASSSDRFITVVSNGVVSERPDGSMIALIERVQGQVDQMVPTLASVAGVPETTFQTAPNSVDLKQFGDKVIENSADISNHKTRISDLESKHPTITPSFSAYLTATTVVAAGNAVPFNATEWNDGGHFNTSNGAFLVSKTGKHIFTVKVTSASTQTMTGHLHLSVNGGRSRDMMEQLSFSANTERSATVILNLSAGQEVKLIMGGSGFTFEGGNAAFYTLFQGHFLH